MTAGDVLTVTAASNISHFFDNFAGFQTQCRGNVRSSISTAGNTERCGVDFTVGQCMRITVAASITTGTAVCTGETLTDRNELFILGNGHKLGCDNQHDAANNTDHSNSNNRNNNTHE